MNNKSPHELLNYCLLHDLVSVYDDHQIHSSGRFFQVDFKGDVPVISDELIQELCYVKGIYLRKEPIIYDVNFECDDCGCRSLIRVVDQIKETNQVVSFKKHGSRSSDVSCELRSENVTKVTGCISGYYCEFCGKLLSNHEGVILTDEDLFDYLTEEDMLSCVDA